MIGFKGTIVEDDTFRWKPDKNGKFSEARIYRKECPFGDIR